MKRLVTASVFACVMAMTAVGAEAPPIATDEEEADSPFTFDAPLTADVTSG